jgi:hypothetical protein
MAADSTQHAPPALAWHASPYIHGALDSDCHRYRVTPTGRGDWLLLAFYRTNAQGATWSQHFTSPEAAQARAQEMEAACATS